MVKQKWYLSSLHVPAGPMLPKAIKCFCYLILYLNITNVFRRLRSLRYIMPWCKKLAGIRFSAATLYAYSMSPQQVVISCVQSWAFELLLTQCIWLLHSHKNVCVYTRRWNNISPLKRIIFISIYIWICLYLLFIMKHSFYKNNPIQWFAVPFSKFLNFLGSLFFELKNLETDDSSVDGH